MKSKLAKLRDKCDAKLQEINRQRNPRCFVCGNGTDTGHHFFPKSTSSRLRYEFDNLIPICHGCHMRHHQAGDPRIHETIIRKKGQAWYDDLDKKSREIVKISQTYYENILKKLEE